MKEKGVGFGHWGGCFDGVRIDSEFAPALCASPADVTPSTQLHLGKASELALRSTFAAPAGRQNGHWQFCSFGARQGR